MLKKVPEGLVVRDGETDLEAMRWVLSHPKDETFLQWQMRQSLLRGPDKFMDRKVTLERAASGSASSGESTPQTGVGQSHSSGATASGSQSATDLGTERCLELARGLLEKYGVPR